MADSGEPLAATRTKSRYGFRGWRRFVKASTAKGWRWLVTVGNHFGAAAVLLGGFASAVLSWTALSWWLTVAYVVVVAFLAFSVGAYEEWKDASQLTGEALMVSFDASLRQLRGERGRANEWLRKSSPGTPQHKSHRQTYS